LRNLKIQKKSF